MQNFIVPAAFGRLRVETRQSPAHRRSGGPAAFGRLRVETTSIRFIKRTQGPAAFGRLRVETWLLLSQIRAT